MKKQKKKKQRKQEQLLVDCIKKLRLLNIRLRMIQFK